MKKLLILSSILALLYSCQKEEYEVVENIVGPNDPNQGLVIIDGNQATLTTDMSSYLYPNGTCKIDFIEDNFVLAVYVSSSTIGIQHVIQADYIDKQNAEASLHFTTFDICNDFDFEITAFDTIAHKLKGKYSGALSNNNDSVIKTFEGDFISDYTVVVPEKLSIEGNIIYDVDGDWLISDVENGINGLEIEILKLNDANSCEVNGFSLSMVFTSHKPGTSSDDGYFKFDDLEEGEVYYMKIDLPPYGLKYVNMNHGLDDRIDSDFNENGVSPLFMVDNGRVTMFDAALGPI
ncbi:MAG: hypothetical protein H6572_01165 [Lewinellaceae bacterium]|nr:hypothetical protein [Lewinellaceae bacterium]